MTRPSSLFMDGQMMAPCGAISRSLKDSLPLYLCDSTQLRPEPDRAGGYSFAEQVELLKATIDTLQPSGEPIYLVTHDWGAYIGYLADAYPQMIHRMVSMDVGANTQPNSSRGHPHSVPVAPHRVLVLDELIPALGRKHAQLMA